MEPRPPLEDNLETEIAVIGAGMAGILIADALRDAGRQVVVLEADRIAGGQTCRTTAKITSQHGLKYRELARTLGPAGARGYAMANEAALDRYRTLIARRGIDCDFEEQSAFVCGGDESVLRAEAECAESLGLPASFTRETPLPFPAAGAVRFDRQAQFHPLKFLNALAGPLRVYEKTQALRVEGRRIFTKGGVVAADRIVFACHYPFVNFPGAYFARMHQERSYVLALENAPMIEGMWLFEDGVENTFSLRTYGDTLLLGGGGHRCGENRDGGRYEELRRMAREWFPGSRETMRWSAQDCVTADGVPYIGVYAKSRPDWYVATGFEKWGMTGSMVAAMLLRDRICGAENPWAKVFDPGRFDGKAVGGVASEGGHALGSFARRFFQIPSKNARELPPGRGGVVFFRGKKAGVFRDGDGQLHPVRPVCPHLGCQLEWNPDERSWDCPCHGSRFDRFGTLLSGPARTGIRFPGGKTPG